MLLNFRAITDHFFKLIYGHIKIPSYLKDCKMKVRNHHRLKTNFVNVFLWGHPKIFYSNCI